jgi:hypothetical protein
MSVEFRVIRSMIISELGCFLLLVRRACTSQSTISEQVRKEERKRKEGKKEGSYMTYGRSIPPGFRGAHMYLKHEGRGGKDIQD